MLTSLARSLRREYRSHRMARFGIWVVAYGVALRVVDLFTAGAPGPLWFLFWVAIIAVVPILLIVLLAGIGGYIINVQFASFLVALRVHDHVDHLQELARVVAHEAHLNGQPLPAGQIDHLKKVFLNELRREHSAEYPGLEVTLLV